jgi:NADH-quinone oxidoreductase subunit E
MKTRPPAGHAKADLDFVDRVINECQGRPGALLSILERVQDHEPYKYLSAETLRYIAQRTDLPLAQIYSFATFYALFNLEPQGEHTVCVCRGTACHTRGSRNLLDRLKMNLNIQPGADEGSADKVSVTTPDRQFTLRTVACFGQCALAPVVEIDHEIYGHVSERTIEREIQEIKKGKVNA